VAAKGFGLEEGCRFRGLGGGFFRRMVAFCGGLRLGLVGWDGGGGGGVWMAMAMAMRSVRMKINRNLQTGSWSLNLGFSIVKSLQQCSRFPCPNMKHTKPLCIS